MQRWRKANPEKNSATRRKCYLKRSNNPSIRLNSNVSRRIRKSLSDDKGKHRWKNLVCYTLEQLKRHLERKFKPGMTWENYGRGGWHIDHIIPVTAFNFQSYSDIDFKRCWALKNLQPLWEKENLSKSNHLAKPFQPALQI